MVIAFTRTIVLYLTLILGVRLMGKRQVGELEPSELVLSLLIADLAAVPMQDFGIPLLSGVIPILTVLAVTMLLSVLTMKSIRLRALLCGRPGIVVRDGKPVQREMRRARFTVDELMEELRMKGYTDLSKVKYAVLETNGQLSVLPLSQTPAEDRGLPVTVVSDGRVLDANLRAAGRDRGWLDAQIAAFGLADARDVFLMTVDELGGVYLCPKDGKGARA